MEFLQKSMNFVRRIFSLVNSHNLLGNFLIPIQALNTNFHLEPKNRKPEIEYRRKYDAKKHYEYLKRLKK